MRVTALAHIAPARGYVHFRTTGLFHPAACLLVWFGFAIAVQFFGWGGVAFALPLIAILAWPARYQAGRLAWRGRWLFLSLWLILAYGVPGELWRGLGWMPSVEGMTYASLHALRLLLLLISLAWLFRGRAHERFLVALWVLAAPLRNRGWSVDRAVARLALVLDYLEQAPPRAKNWRHLLDLSEEIPKEQRIESIVLDLPRWQGRDWIFLSGMLILFVGLALLP